MNNIKLEIVCVNLESALSAQEGGADRIELCDNLQEGGTTPSFGMIEAVKKIVSIPVYVMIRPRGGDFLYSDFEIEIMKRDIEICKQLKVDGIVFGILKNDGNIDKKKCKKLLEVAYPLPVTFHRAFDMTVDPSLALEEIIECGFERILTSGLKPTAQEGTETISKLIKQANERIVIMPGGGVRPENVKELISATGATEVHASAKMMRVSKMKFKNGAVKMGQTANDEFNVSVGDVEMIKKLKATIQSF